MNLTTKPEQDDLLATHYYLCSGIITRINKIEGIGELFDEGEDSFVINLIPYSLVVNAIHGFYSEQDPPGVFHYEISEELAAELWVTLCESSGETWGYPDIQTFTHFCHLLIRDWFNEEAAHNVSVREWMATRLSREPLNEDDEAEVKNRLFITDRRERND